VHLADWAERGIGRQKDKPDTSFVLLNSHFPTQLSLPRILGELNLVEILALGLLAIEIHVT